MILLVRMMDECLMIPRGLPVYVPNDSLMIPKGFPQKDYDDDDDALIGMTRDS